MSITRPNFFVKAQFVQGQDLQTLARKLNKLGKAARRTKRRALGQVSKEIARGMKDASPVDTGALRRAWGTIRAKNDIYYTGVRRDYTDRKTQKRPVNYAYAMEKKYKFATGWWSANSDRVEGMLINAFVEQIEKEKQRLKAAR
jgi:hypothetical protein